MHRWGLLAGWAVGMALGTWMANRLEFKGTLYPLTLGPWTVTGYAALWALLANFGVAIVVSAALHGARVPAGEDATREADYGGL
jgi:SSS family solute:Na+ symporter